MGREEEKRSRKHRGLESVGHDDFDATRDKKLSRGYGHRKDRKKKESLSRKDDPDEERGRRHRKRRERDDGDDDSSSRSRHHRRNDSHRRKSSREDRHERKKKNSKKKSREYSDDEESRKKSKRKNKESRKKLDKSSLYPMGAPLGRAPDNLVNAETDYFTYHQEFWVYLFREEGTRFNDLSSNEARQAFRRFASEYNAGHLEQPYYDNPPSFPSPVLEESKTTQHKWGFQTSETERRGLEELQARVRRLTEYKDGVIDSGKQIESSKNTQTNPDTSAHDDDNKRRQMTPEERAELRRGNRRLREHVRTTEEEITGGAKDFRERQIEKKREQAARTHGASRDKEDGTSTELDDSAIYGNGEVSFKDALAREKKAKQQREEKRNARVEELQNRERERQENMLKMLGVQGVKPGQKIQIAPRQDNNDY